MDYLKNIKCGNTDSYIIDSGDDFLFEECLFEILSEILSALKNDDDKKNKVVQMSILGHQNVFSERNILLIKMFKNLNDIWFNNCPVISFNKS
jgi:hypothetical protein